MKLRLLFEVWLVALVFAPVATAYEAAGAQADSEIDYSLTDSDVAWVETTQFVATDGAFADSTTRFELVTNVPSWDLMGRFFGFKHMLGAAVRPAENEVLAQTHDLQDAAADAAPDETAISGAAARARYFYARGATVSTETEASNTGAEFRASGTVGEESVGAGASTEKVATIGPEGGSEPAPAQASPVAEPASAPVSQDEAPAPMMDAPVTADTVSAPVIVADDMTPAEVLTNVAITTAATGAVAFIFPGGRLALWKLAKKLGLLALFSRIAQEDILNHGRRNDLMEFIRHNPGERVEVARRELGISNGSMHYHLRVLQDRNLVRVLKDGSIARLYPAGPKINPIPYVPPQRRKFLDTVGSMPGLTQRELAINLGLSERMVSYHVQALTLQGLIDVQSEGARKRVFPRQQVLLAN